MNNVFIYSYITLYRVLRLIYVQGPVFCGKRQVLPFEGKIGNREMARLRENM